MANITNITIPAVIEKRTRMVEVIDDVVVEEKQELIQLTLTPKEAAHLAAILENRNAYDDTDDTLNTSSIFYNLLNFTYTTLGLHYYKNQKVREREWKKTRIVYESGGLNDAAWVDAYFVP